MFEDNYNPTPDVQEYPEIKSENVGDNADEQIDQLLDSSSELPEQLAGFGQSPLSAFQKRSKNKVLDLSDPQTLNIGFTGQPNSHNRSGDTRYPYGKGYSRDGYRVNEENSYNDRPYNNDQGYNNNRPYNSGYNRGYNNNYNNNYNSGYNRGYNNNSYNNNTGGGYNNNYNNNNNGGGYSGGYNNNYGQRKPYGGYSSYNRYGNRPYYNRYQSNYIDPLSTDPDNPQAQPRAPRKPKPYEINPNEMDKALLMDDPINLEDEPLSIAEELAEEINQGKPAEDEFDKIYKKLRQTNFNNMADLQKLTMTELIEVARSENLDIIDEEGAQRQDLIFKILKERIKLNGLIYGEGTLEILPDGFGFLRSSDYHYISCPDDIYVSPSQIRRFGLKNGVTISGQIRPPKENERYFALLRVEAINYREPNELMRHKDFEELTAIHPTERIKMETTQDELNTRVTDLVTPLGFGQRALIVSPPRAGKTILMQKMAKAALRNYPDLYVIMLLIDERPEEVTDMERQVKGPNCEVISSTFDETSSRHIQVSEMVLEKAKRMVEYGRDVLVFLDSITRLARAWNAECPMGGKIMSGGVDANALQNPKKFFGSARRVEEGGSLTIVATALVDTGSRMDEVIFEEFKGTGNMEIVLDRTLVERRIWPSIDINASGTRREEMLRSPEDQAKIAVIRRALADLNPCDAMETLTAKLARTRSNADFLDELRNIE